MIKCQYSRADVFITAYRSSAQFSTRIVTMITRYNVKYLIKHFSVYAVHYIVLSMLINSWYLPMKIMDRIILV